MSAWTLNNYFVKVDMKRTFIALSSRQELIFSTRETTDLRFESRRAQMILTFYFTQLI